MMTATEAFHNALDEYRYTGGTDYNTTRRFYEDTHWVLNISAKMPELAHSDMANVLNSAEFRTWTGEGCTYASAARLIRAKLAPVVNGNAACPSPKRAPPPAPVFLSIPTDTSPARAYQQVNSGHAGPRLLAECVAISRKVRGSIHAYQPRHGTAADS